jgi:hypothetical protein
VGQYIPEFQREAQREARRALLWVVIGGYVLALCFGIIGILLLLKGGQAQSNIHIFGQTINTQSVGVDCIAIGAIMAVLVTRRASTSYDASQRLLRDSLEYIVHAERKLRSVWPDERTVERLAEHIERMSKAEGAALKALWKHARSRKRSARIKVPSDIFDALQSEDKTELLLSALNHDGYVTYVWISEDDKNHEDEGYYLYKDVIPLIRSSPKIQQLISRFPDLAALAQDDLDHVLNH